MGSDLLFRTIDSRTTHAPGSPTHPSLSPTPDTDSKSVLPTLVPVWRSFPTGVPTPVLIEYLIP
jgi:hypothetical protein